MPQRKTLKQIVAEEMIEIQTRQRLAKPPLPIVFPPAPTEDDTFYPEYGSPLAEYERTHFKGKK